MHHHSFEYKCKSLFRGTTEKLLVDFQGIFTSPWSAHHSLISCIQGLEALWQRLLVVASVASSGISA